LLLFCEPTSIIGHTARPRPIAVADSPIEAASSSWLRTCIPHAQLSQYTAYQAEGPHIGWQGPLCATVTCDDPGAHLPSEYDGFEASSLCAQQTSISDQLICPLEVARKRRIRAIRPTFMRSRDLRGRMRRLGASCTATKTYALSKHVPPQEYRRIRAGRRQILRIFKFVITANIHEEAGGPGLHSDIRRQPWLLTCGIRSRHAVSAH
jgi:hypothetical protein